MILLKLNFKPNPQKDVAELYELTPEEAQYMSQMVARGERSRTF